MHYALIALIKSDKTVQCERALMHNSCNVIMTARETAIKTMIIFPTKVIKVLMTGSTVVKWVIFNKRR